MPDDPVAAYFTPERLERYRQLHQQFPLWCGHWPEELETAPERTMWTLRRRVRLEGPAIIERVPELARLDAERKTRLLFVPLQASQVTEAQPPVVLAGFLDIAAFIDSGPGGTEHDWVRPVEPPSPERELLQAIAYTLARWPLQSSEQAGTTVPGEPDPVAIWTRRLADELRHDFPVVGELYNRHDPPRSSFALVNEHLQLTERGARQPMLDHLREAWIELGERVGILPSKKGGEKCSLPNEFLCEFDAEVNRLREAVENYPVHEEEKAIVLRLIIGPDAYDKERDLAEQLADARRKRARSATAEPGPYAWAENLFQQHRVERWVVRLAFPMLAQSEVSLFRGLAQRTIGGHHTTVAREALAVRLGLSEGTLLIRLSS